MCKKIVKPEKYLNLWSINDFPLLFSTIFVHFCVEFYLKKKNRLLSYCVIFMQLFQFARFKLIVIERPCELGVCTINPNSQGRFVSNYLKKREFWSKIIISEFHSWHEFYGRQEIISFFFWYWKFRNHVFRYINYSCQNVLFVDRTRKICSKSIKLLFPLLFVLQEKMTE